MINRICILTLFCASVLLYANDENIREQNNVESTKSAKVVQEGDSNYDKYFADEDSNKSEIDKFMNNALGYTKDNYGFLGIELGFGKSEFMKVVTSSTAVIPKIFGGYSWTLGKYFDYRVYADIAFGEYKHKYYYYNIYPCNIKSSYVAIGFLNDFIWRFYRNDLIDSGLFVGFGFDVGIWKYKYDISYNLFSDNYVDIGLLLDVGLSATIMKHHGIEFGINMQARLMPSSTSSYYYGLGSYSSAYNRPDITMFLRYFYKF